MSRGAGPLAGLHVVTDDEVLARDGWSATAVSVLEAGGPALALQLRGPRSSGSVLFGCVRALLPHARRVGALLTVNDRVDVALAAGTDAVHLGQRSLPVAEARRLLGPAACIGASCQAGPCALAALSEGADYAFAGNVFGTPSHPGRVGLGPTGFNVVAATARPLPVLAIGGIEVAGVASLVEAGAYGVAVLRGVWDAPEPASAVNEYISSLARALEPSARPPGDRDEKER